jgi:SAM-dependent methyltransferase
MAAQGKVFALDYSDVSVAVARKLNARLIETGRVEIHEGSVSELPFAADTFDRVTAVETHFWWPDLPAGMREIQRVLKPGGTLAIVVGQWKAKTVTHAIRNRGNLQGRGDEDRKTGGETYIQDWHEVPERRRASWPLADAGYADVRIVTESGKGWICGIGKKPST